MNNHFANAIKVVACELESNSKCFEIWQRGMTTSFSKALIDNIQKLKDEKDPTALLLKTAFIGAGQFLESVIDGSKTEHGWVYRQITEVAPVPEASDQIIKNLAVDPITGPLLQIILTGFSAFCAENYDAIEGENISHLQKAQDYLKHLDNESNK